MGALERVHLSILREVERSGSLTAAARSLGLTQSALSHSVKKLEQLLGAALWERHGRGLRLTTAGEYLLALANRILPQLEHAEQTLQQLAQGVRGTLRIGMECHPCYEWLLQVVSPYLGAWPDVDLDVKQKFQFGGVGALLAYEIDMLVTPDPVRHRELSFEPVLDYEQVLVVSKQHPLASRTYVLPSQLGEETLITYPVEIARLDIYSQFLLPARVMPKEHKTIETTDIMLQMVASGRGVTALPGWLVAEYKKKLAIKPVRLGRAGVPKQIFLGTRTSDLELDYVTGFIELARSRRVGK